MKILIMGGARFIGKTLISQLIANKHDVTIANRGSIKDSFGDAIKRRVITARNDRDCLKQCFAGESYDLIIDNLAFDSYNVDLLLDTIPCKKYMFISSAGVYYPNKHIDVKEDEFDPYRYDLVIAKRDDGLDYVNGKKLAEAMAFQKYGRLKPIAVRFPLVIGVDDYTQRLKKYVDCIKNETPIYIDNMDNSISFVSPEEAGQFMAFLADSDFSGGINGCSGETVQIKHIVSYIEKQTGKKAILSDKGEPMPYNGEVNHRLSNCLAGRMGFNFSDAPNYVFETIDSYLKM